MFSGTVSAKNAPIIALKGKIVLASSKLWVYQEDGETKFERVPVRFWGNMKEEYEKHNPDYAGVYKPEN